MLAYVIVIVTIMLVWEGGNYTVNIYHPDLCRHRKAKANRFKLVLLTLCCTEFVRDAA